MSDNLKKITIPANGPGPHKEMAKRVKAALQKFDKHTQFDTEGVRGAFYTARQFVEMQNEILDIIKEYDIADAMRNFEGKDK